MGKTIFSARGGFFFAVMALAILSLVLMTVQVWVKTFEQSDYRASQRFKGEAVRSILGSLSDKTLSDFANASAFYATYKLVNYTSNQGLGLGQAPGLAQANNSGTGNVESAAIGLMMNGSGPQSWGIPLEYSEEEKSAYTLEGWQNKTDAAANAMGFDIRFSGARNFRYYQIDTWTVGVSFDLEMNITDLEGSMRQNKTMHAKSSFPILGFLDPMITRKDMEHRFVDRGSATEKQIFKNDLYEVPGDVRPKLMRDMVSPGDGTGPEGNGWFFGPITELYPSEISSSLDAATDAAQGTGAGVTLEKLNQYVLASPYNGSLPGVANSYGAVIVTTEPVPVRTVENGCNVTRQTKCLNCMKRTEAGPGCPATGWEQFSPGNNRVDVPVIVATNWHTTDVTPVTRAQPGGSITDYYVLIDNEQGSRDEKMTGYHRVWDITRLRDMAICGFYVSSSGPSFFQRMLSGAENIKNPDLGIESFVVGQWAGGAEDRGGNYAADLYSRLDWEFYQGLGGNDVSRIKGMMGCKGRDMCVISNLNATKIGVGKFRLSDDAAARYGAEAISCKATPSAPCD